VVEAVADPVRRQILDRLATGPQPVSHIARGLPVGRPAVSMHLRVLRDAGVVTVRPAGNRRLYQLNAEAMRRLREHFDWYWAQALGAFQEAAEEEARKEAPMMEEEEVLITIEVTVRAPLAVAFRVFTGLRWWPVATHHLADPPGEEAILEPFVGGRWYERGPGDRERDWGRVLVWEPPHRVLLTWLVGPDWTFEPDPARASEIEVMFAPMGDEETRVEYSHRHLERYGREADRMLRALSGPSAAAHVVETFASVLPLAAAQGS
jgi:uncharacterized protein YndB with AHSA1/START domain